jgi:hypothetical protein
MVLKEKGHSLKKLMGIILCMAIIVGLFPNTTTRAGADSQNTIGNGVQYVGDVDGDGSITPKDVTKMRRFLAGGWDVDVVTEDGDVDGDGAITPKDVTKLRRYLAGGWGAELPVKTTQEIAIFDSKVCLGDITFPINSEWKEVSFGSGKAVGYDCDTIVYGIGAQLVIYVTAQISETDYQQANTSAENFKEFAQGFVDEVCMGINAKDPVIEVINDTEGYFARSSGVGKSGNYDMPYTTYVKLKDNYCILTAAFCIGMDDRASEENDALAGETYRRATLNFPVVINTENFPDEIFRTFISDHFDENSDGELSKEEIAKVYRIDCMPSAYLSDEELGIDASKYDNANDLEKAVDSAQEIFRDNGGGIKTIKGIEYFTNLEGLSCKYNNISNIDLRNNVKLLDIDCGYNEISEIDLRNNVMLTNIELCSNNLKTLDLSKNRALEYLDCDENLLSSLDLSANSDLICLYCGYNYLGSLNLSNNMKLVYLGCNGCEFQSLDISQNEKLKKIWCADNQLEELDLSNNTELSYLDCRLNKITTLNISNNLELDDENIKCDENVSIIR